MIRLYLKIPENFVRLVSRTDSGLCIYHLFVWSNFNILYSSKWITFYGYLQVFSPILISCLSLKSKRQQVSLLILVVCVLVSIWHLSFPGSFGLFQKRWVSYSPVFRTTFSIFWQSALFFVFFHFHQWSAWFLLIKTRSVRLAWIGWSVCISNS